MVMMANPKVMSMWDDHDAHMLWLDRYFGCHIMLMLNGNCFSAGHTFVNLRMV